MIPKKVRVNMTRAQLSRRIYDLSRFRDYEQRQRRLHIIKKYNVRVEVNKSIRKCYVNGRLVICTPYAEICRTSPYTALYAFNTALRAVLDALHAVKEV